MNVERFPVEEGPILMFARSIGDTNPIYTDAEYAASTELGGIIAPPTFVQSSAQFDPDYPLRPTPGEPWIGSGRTPSGSPRPDRDGDGVGLHAEQHFEYHRPLFPGDILTVSSTEGESWEKEGRSGRLRFHELITEYRTTDDELVVTARAVVVVTERPPTED